MGSHRLEGQSHHFHLWSVRGHQDRGPDLQVRLDSVRVFGFREDPSAGLMSARAFPERFFVILEFEHIAPPFLSQRRALLF